MKDDKQPIEITGRTFVTGALADIFGSRALVQRDVKVGDMKLWCHLRPGARVWSGRFRSAVYDGRGWRTFRLTIVTDNDARYDTFDERPVKARRCFDAIAHLKGQLARYRASDGTWGCTFTMQAPAANSAARTTTGDTAGGNVTPPALQPAPAPATAARMAQPPATATKLPASSSRSRGKRGRKGGDGRQLTLF